MLADLELGLEVGLPDVVITVTRVLADLELELEASLTEDVTVVIWLLADFELELEIGFTDDVTTVVRVVPDLLVVKLVNGLLGDVTVLVWVVTDWPDFGVDLEITGVDLVVVRIFCGDIDEECELGRTEVVALVCMLLGLPALELQNVLIVEVITLV